MERAVRPWPRACDCGLTAAAGAAAAAWLHGCCTVCSGQRPAASTATPGVAAAHLRRIGHAEAEVDGHVTGDAQHANASVLQLRLHAEPESVRPEPRLARTGRGQQSNGYATHLASPLQGHNVREEQRVEALVAGHGAVERRGRGEEGNGLRLLLPGGHTRASSALGSPMFAAACTVRTFQRCGAAPPSARWRGQQLVWPPGWAHTPA